MTAPLQSHDFTKYIDIFCGRHYLIPDTMDVHVLAAAYRAAGWKWGPSWGDEHFPSAAELEELLADTKSDGLISGGIAWRQSVGHFLHEDVWRHLPQHTAEAPA